MKKIILGVVAAVFLVSVSWAIFYFWKTYGGFWRNISEPSVNIVNSLENQNTPSEQIIPPSFPLTLPAGFRISIFAKALASPRVIISDEAGGFLASVTSQGKVLALPDKNRDGVADEIITVLSGLNNPHGLAMQCESEKCNLYVAESDKLSVYNYDQERSAATNGEKIIDLPSGGGHFTRTIGFGPDGRLYVSVGSSCNVCLETDERRAKIFSINPDGSDFREYARGLRNAVFFTWSPIDGRMWATEMGRDFLGDNLPPDEINIIEEEKNYGWPNCYGKNIHDTNFDKNVYIRNPCLEPFESPSHIDIPAHSAPLGLAFVAEGSGWPKDYENNLLVAYHGSWNRSVPTGYKIVRYKLDAEGNYLSEENFVSGWLTADGEVLGRPAGILFFDGAAYVSDDKAGVIYKITYHP